MSSIHTAPIRASDLSFEPERLNDALERIQTRFPLHEKYWQMALTHSHAVRTPKERVYDGLGPLRDPEGNYLRNPADFVIFNDDFKDLYFYDVYRKVMEWSPKRIGRVRLMLRPPSSCYSMHKDESERLHIAVHTNQSSYFFFKAEGVFQIPADGKVYHFDATRLHTGFNAGKTNRIHLVFDTIDWCFENQ